MEHREARYVVDEGKPVIRVRLPQTAGRIACAVSYKSARRYRGRKVSLVINEAVNLRPGCKKMKFPSRARRAALFRRTRPLYPP